MKFRSFLSYFLLFLALIPMGMVANPSFWVKALHDARSNPVTTLVIGGVYSIAGYYAFQEGYSWYKRRMLNSATILKLINQADTTVKINELGFFEMKENGLQEVPNINEHLIAELSHAPGSVLVSVIEGSKPLLIELQALSIESKLGIPQRVVSGLDQKQVVLIAAILEKYLHVKFSTQDIFFKVSGGFKIKGSSCDLGIALALLSSYFQQSLPDKSIALGEISLTGEIKPINQINLFVKEAEKFGIQQLLVAKNQKIESSACQPKRFTNVYELLALFS